MEVEDLNLRAYLFHAWNARAVLLICSADVFEDESMFLSTRLRVFRREMLAMDFQLVKQVRKFCEFK